MIHIASKYINTMSHLGLDNTFLVAWSCRWWLIAKILSRNTFEIVVYKMPTIFWFQCVNMLIKACGRIYRWPRDKIHKISDILQSAANTNYNTIFPRFLSTCVEEVICYQPWWRHQMETFSALLALCAGNSPVTGEFPSQRPVTWSFNILFDLGPNISLSKQLWGWWFETPSRSLWRHCNDIWLCRPYIIHFAEPENTVLYIHINVVKVDEFYKYTQRKEIQAW